ncbi:outer membrane protein assembly factor BamD [Mucilaginibacter arboris]|uniref:Outer membrane protein assembly factor BamD n=1 Tax=Mucilaginibacter arboris TaxID=2682090 RepID=A0A7K1T173_9SPHI|nr:outer membrane protein assembly factor BamD [Mucilaginibacter arboris]MVN23304.1 outer membrane protein assembly factor BamD [Mucilaginibacter arboris]
MFKKRCTVSILTLLFILSIGLFSCKSKFEKLKASNDYSKKYQEGIKYYNKKDYSRALALFDDLVQRYRGRSEAEDLFYYYAFANYKLRDYTSAGYHFKNFADTYPNSARAEECRYMAAYCSYLESPNSTLDQTNTLQSIDKLQLFINLYPKSSRVAEASKLIQNLRDRLETKSYDNAKLYLTIGDYKSAVIAFKNSMRDFPDTKYSEEMEFLTIQAQYLYAKNSLETKQEERYQEAINAYSEFKEKYPSSQYLKQADALSHQCEAGIQNVKKYLANIDNEQKAYKKQLEQEKSRQQTDIKTP